MINQLPRWVWTGAWALAFIAGIVNVVGLLGFEHQAITHLTGTTSLLGAALGTLHGAQALHLLAVIISFVAGTALSGFINCVTNHACAPRRRDDERAPFGR
ncbi:MAG: DUF1275 domain-containing protein [Opitutaceae bacterium]|nr:DUF1275 domain-containing protein [Opitutaceae bacterium]